MFSFFYLTQTKPSSSFALTSTNDNNTIQSPKTPLKNQFEFDIKAFSKNRTHLIQNPLLTNNQQQPMGVMMMMRSRSRSSRRKMTKHFEKFIIQLQSFFCGKIKETIGVYIVSKENITMK